MPRWGMAYKKFWEPHQASDLAAHNLYHPIYPQTYTQCGQLQKPMSCGELAANIYRPRILQLEKSVK